MKPLAKTYLAPIPSALPITEAELLALGVPQSAIDAGEMRAEVTTTGPWQIVTSLKALCTSTVWGEDRSPCVSERLKETVYGIRTLSKARASGYAMEGRVSVNGREIRGFTSSQLFELPSGKLVNVATIHACL